MICDEEVGRGCPGSPGCHEESEARIVKVNLLTFSIFPRRLKWTVVSVARPTKTSATKTPAPGAGCIRSNDCTQLSALSTLSTWSTLSTMSLFTYPVYPLYPVYHVYPVWLPFRTPYLGAGCIRSDDSWWGGWPGGGGGDAGGKKLNPEL